MTAPLPDLVTRQEAAEILDVDLTTVDRYARRGADDPLRLERLKSGTGAVRFRRRDVERLRDRRETVL